MKKIESLGNLKSPYSSEQRNRIEQNRVTFNQAQAQVFCLQNRKHKQSCNSSYIWATPVI